MRRGHGEGQMLKDHTPRNAILVLLCRSELRTPGPPCSHDLPALSAWQKKGDGDWIVRGDNKNTNHSLTSTVSIASPTSGRLNGCSFKRPA